MTEGPTHRYRVVSQIGRGGMATVWRAVDTVLDRDVALKRLRPSLLDDQEAVGRFKREAETVARLAHPGLVHLLDRGEDDEGPFLVMELVDGEDLKTRIRREGPLDPLEAAHICADVARALDHAHRNGIVHRDIKSQNVLITQEGTAKLTDFGIARLMEGHQDIGLTRTGMLVGSSDYLAPEQAEGQPIDGRTDIYSLGIVLWECLTGRLPFTGDSFLAVAMRHVSDPLPDPRSIQPGIPSQIAACAMRAAAKNPAHRFKSAATFARALEERDSSDTAAFTMPDEYDLTQSDTQRRRRPAKRRSSLAGLAGMVAVLVVGAGVFVGYQALTNADSPQVDQQAAQTLSLVDGVTAIDPRGDGQENPEQTALAVDGNPDTQWNTEGYDTSPEFGGLEKDGVGLVLRVDPAYRPTQVEIIGSEGATFEVRNNGEPPFADEPLAKGTFTGQPQTITLNPGAGSEILVWITKLSPEPSSADGRYRASVREVTIKGVPNRST